MELSEIEDVRTRFATAREVAAGRFREQFAEHPELAPNERWHAHLEIVAASLVEALSWVSLPEGFRIAYRIDEQSREIAPMVLAEGQSVESVRQENLEAASVLFPYFRIDHVPIAVFEYWLFISEILSSPSWRMTRLIVTSEEYNEALGRIRDTRFVRPLYLNYLPSAEWRDDGTAALGVTLYSRAGEERIERRHLVLDRNHEFHVHGRDLIAEGTAGVR